MPKPLSAPVLSALRKFAAALPAAGARVFAPGAAPESPAGRPWSRVGLAALGMPPESAEPLHGAWIEGALEREEWDRWLLQQVHGRLVDGAPLVVVVPDRDAWLTPAGLAFLAGRIAARLRRRLSPLAPPPAFTGRRYRAAELVRMLVSLHFELDGEVVHVGGGGLLAFARRRPGLLRRLREGRAPDPARFTAAFAAEHARFESIRDHWLARHPALAPAACTPFDAAAYAGAQVLVLAPHADDELVGAAGTLLQLARHGARITIVHATDGAASAALSREPEASRTTVRLEEARRVGQALGAARLEFWKEDNRAFRVREETVARLRRLLEELHPRLIVTPFVTDIHPDHFTLNRVLEAALHGAHFDASNCRVLYSEIWSHVPADTVCDVTDDEERVENLILMYTTAMKVDDLPHLCESRYYFNACRLLGRGGFAEGFYSAPASRHAELMATGGADLA